MVRLDVGVLEVVLHATYFWSWRVFVFIKLILMFDLYVYSNPI